jgi:ABC-type lipoprotein export system ATPase subunit
MDLVRCENVIKIHRQGNLEVVALQGLDFRMIEGEFVAVVGPSGAGKSSLLHILGGMDYASAGNVEVAATDLSETASPDLQHHFRRNVGLLWQDYTRNLIPYLTALGNVELPMMLGGAGKEARQSRARELLELTGLDAKPYANVNTMSGGEQQRLALCVALSLEPKLLLADEPTGELDTERSIEIFELLSRLCHTEGLGVVVVTHDAILATRADRTVRLEDGRVLTERRLHGDAELLTVDQRGRIQLPREMLEAAGIGDRLEVEATPEGIVLRRHDDGA